MPRTRRTREVIDLTTYNNPGEDWDEDLTPEATRRSPSISPPREERTAFLGYVTEDTLSLYSRQGPLLAQKQKSHLRASRRLRRRKLMFKNQLMIMKDHLLVTKEDFLNKKKKMEEELLKKKNEMDEELLLLEKKILEFESSNVLDFTKASLRRDSHEKNLRGLAQRVVEGEEVDFSADSGEEDSDE